MTSPHLRRRYRASGTRSGLAYLLGILAAASLYVGQHVYTVRQQVVVEALRKETDVIRLELDRLTGVRDGLMSLSNLEPQAHRLGLELPDLAQTAQLPLDAPVLYEPATPAQAPAFVEAARRIWGWLDVPGIGTNEVRAGQ